ncbi:hypothetical protein [uncultured Parabacteroides sp.]|uniref:hypothetical protein n=1 Tax=uncultured Parabacteroides sp. TaxID=512312 RepID=UPI002637C56C|nr:hypothetical protein [uncultured Parabacteroides sp.]
MRRVASHYVYWNGLFRMHYVELDDEGCLAGVYPLDSEIAGTEFYDGILFPVVEVGKELHAGETKVSCLRAKSLMLMEPGFDACRELGLPQAAAIGEAACLLLLAGIPLTTAEFGADDGRSDGYIQRL